MDKKSKKSNNSSAISAITVLCIFLINAGASIINAGINVIILIAVILIAVVVIVGYVYSKYKKQNYSNKDSDYSYNNTKKSEPSVQPPEPSAKKDSNIPVYRQNTQQAYQTTFFDKSKAQWKDMYKDGLVTLEEYNDHIEKIKRGG